ncbi:MAG: SurA N-terminal domain-containing protein [Opitutales bacterium]|nr:SurA N-terminal domain-containing protein [Opitutales bacterium]
MITWIQTRFQKHFKWLFMALLVVMIFTFVLTIGNQSFFGSHDTGRYKVQDFYGYNLASEGTKSYLQQAANLSANVSPEIVQQIGYGFDMEMYAKQRAVGLSLARMLGVASPDEAQLADYARSKPIFMDENGKFSAKQYKDVMNVMALRMRVPEATVIRILEEDFRIAKVREILGGAGFIDPDAIALDRQMAGTEWTFAVAQIPFDSFKPEINPSAEELKAFYDENPGRFEIPEKIQLTQVRFSTMPFVAQVESPSEEQVQAFFERNKYRYAPAPVQKEDGSYERAEPVLDETVRAAVVQDIIQSLALQAAAQKADEYTVALWREEVPQDSPRVIELAKSMGGTISQIQPYARDAAPRHADLAPSQLNAQWELATSERYFSDVLPGPGCASVLIYNSTLPSRQPAYEEVTVEVADTYQVSKKAELFIAYADQLRTSIEAGLDAGRQFADVAAELGLKSEQHDKLTLENVNAELGMSGGPLDVVSRLEPGALSPVQLTRSGAFVALLQDKQLPDLDSVRADAEQMKMIRASVSSTDAWSILAALAQKREAELIADLGKGSEE